MFAGHRISAVITCAGKGIRFGGNKLLAELDGATVIERTVRAFECRHIDEVVVVVSRENEELYREILHERAGLSASIVTGAAERHLSAQRGLAATSGDFVVVHDGVRPFVTESLIERVLSAATTHGAAMLGMPSTVQVKQVSHDEFVTGSLDRSASWLGQTPQAFRRDLLEDAYSAAIASGYERVSDDADLVAEFTGHGVKIVEGHVDNIKITTPQDLELAQLIARRVKSAQPVLP